MLSGRFRNAIISLCVHFASCATAVGVPRYDRYHFAVLDAQMESRRTGEYRTMDRLFDVKKNSSNPDALFVDLLDYYLGEAGGLTLAEFLSEGGTRMLPLLEAKRLKPLECLPKYTAICADNVDNRNERINWITDAIRKGVILRAEEPAGK